MALADGAGERGAAAGAGAEATGSVVGTGAAAGGAAAPPRLPAARRVRSRRLQEPGRPGPGTEPRRRRLHRSSGRQERQRIEVALRVGGDPHTQVNIRLPHLGVAARADRPDAVALGDRRALATASEPRCVSVTRRLRRSWSRELARAGHGARERHRAGSRCDDDGRPRRDIDAAMLSRGIRVRGIEDERLQDTVLSSATSRHSRRARARRTSPPQAPAARELGCRELWLQRVEREAEIDASASPSLSEERTLSHGTDRCEPLSTRLQSCHKVPR